MKENFFGRVSSFLILMSAPLYLGRSGIYAANDAGGGGGGSSSSGKDYLAGINEGVGMDLGTWVTTTINWAIGIATLICVVMLIAAGYNYITAAGDEAKIQKATKTLTWAIVGLVICFISVILVQFVVTNVLKK